MKLVTYLNFDGNCREAMTFYKQCLGGELTIMPFSDMPGNPAKDQPDRVLHASLDTKAGTILMASDSMPGHPRQKATNFAVSVHCDSVEEIDRLFAAVGEKGKIEQPVSDTFWNARFGMLTDQFGIPWMFNHPYPPK
ncbi:MAG: VOC family protein [Acidobacteriota bacterium]